MTRSTVLVTWAFASVYLLPSALDFILAIALYLLWWSEREEITDYFSAGTDPLFLCATALILLVGISGLWSDNTSAPDFIQLWARILCTLGVIITVARALSHQHGFSIYFRHVIVFAALVSTVLCIAWYIVGPPADHARMHGLFRLNNAGRAGHQYAATLPFLAATLHLGRGQWRIIAGAALFTTIVALVLTGTRAGWLGGALGLLSYAVATWKNDARIYLGIMTAVAASVGALFLFASFQNDTALGELLLPRGDSYRVAIWRTHMESILQGAFILGDGALTQQPWVDVLDRNFRGAHNIYLSVAQQIGVTGLLLFLGTMGWTAARLISNLHLVTARVGLSMLLTGFVVGFFNGDRLIDKLGLVWFVLWLPVAIAMAVAVMEKRKGDSQ